MVTEGYVNTPTWHRVLSWRWTPWLMVVVGFAMSASVFVLSSGPKGQASIRVSCYMNGLGNGFCEFANRGDAEGDRSVTMVVENVVTGESTTMDGSLYSGMVKPGDVRKREFLVYDVDDLCHLEHMPHGMSWRDICTFRTIEVFEE